MSATKRIDRDMVQKLAAIGCTNKEIASVLECNDDYLGRACADELVRGREQGKMRLRQKQMEVAMKGNVPMLIFLGKNMLGQSDKQEIKNENVGHIIKFNWGAAGHTTDDTTEAATDD